MKNTKNIKKPMPKKAKRVLSIWISIVMMITMSKALTTPYVCLQTHLLRIRCKVIKNQ